MHNFMLSYGLKPYNDEDYKEAHLIIDEMKKNDYFEQKEREQK